MKAQPPPSDRTLAEVLAWENLQVDRYEYVDGILRMMVGGTAAHNRIIFRLRSILDRQVQARGCQTFSESLKLMVQESSAFTYPDVMVVCGEVLPSADHVTDATLVAEILSRSTADHDRGAKWRIYQALPSLRAYLLVAQDRREVEIFRREGSGWRFDRITEGRVEPLAGVGIDLEDLYRDVLPPR